MTARNRTSWHYCILFSQLVKAGGVSLTASSKGQMSGNLFTLYVRSTVDVDEPIIVFKLNDVCWPCFLQLHGLPAYFMFLFN